MTLRNLPTIKAPQALKALEGKVEFAPAVEALDKWHPEIRAAQEDDATITIYGEIGDDPYSEGGGVTARRIGGALRQIGKRDVTVNINSPGGDFFEGLAIYNLLREHEAAINVRVVGLASSAASLVMLAGDSIKVAKAGFVFVHNVWGLVIGNRHDMAKAAADFAAFDDSIAEMIVDRSGQEKKTVAQWLDSETFFSGQEAVEAGLADGLLAADAVSETASGAAALNRGRALRQVDAALAAQGMSRKERRALLQALKDDGMPSAAGEDGTPGATDWLEQARGLLNSISKGK